MRLRLRYAKVGKVRFTSHRDTARIWERALRRASLPVALSGGYTPRPKVSFGLALPTGTESIAEYVDVDLVRPLGPDELGAVVDRLTPTLPVGFTVLAAAAVEPSDRSLQEAVTSVTWELQAPAGVDVAAVAARLSAAEELPIDRERKGHRHRDDIRPQLLALRAGGGPTLVADLATVGRGVRPAELAELAFPEADPFAVRALRTHQWIEHDGRRRELLALDFDVRAAVGAGAVVVPTEVGA